MLSYEHRLRQLIIFDTAAEEQILFRFRQVLNDSEVPPAYSISQFTRLATAMTAIQRPPTLLWQIFHESAIREPERDAFSREALNIIADLTTNVFRVTDVSTTDTSSL